MTIGRDVDLLASAAGSLSLTPRGQRWCHLSLCVLDAVFSINANYSTTTRTVHAYARSAGLEPVLAPAADVAAGQFQATEQNLRAFVSTAGALDPDAFASLLDNRQLTSTRSGIRKAAAAQRYAQILIEHGLLTLSDVGTVLGDAGRTRKVERALAAVPGHGSGVRVSYLWMLAGDDEHVKADRMVQRWVSRALGRPVGSEEAALLLAAAAGSLGVTPWVLDHAVWSVERR
ncbi:hypothetical protein [Nocardioides sp. Leaf285]|uniref:hypothetical protein n=1 Tax=Nocardioides sp. Leaf285 TaxID=1736322 RepID=UPI0007031A24|nr:hypothetical protein [Nocardioides sp. Leaf285]KQP63150.1 hypothetical protein ASF47_19260 [Nocardioides sp. Leaf285]